MMDQKQGRRRYQIKYTFPKEGRNIYSERNISQHCYCWKAIIAIMIKHMDVAKYQEGQSSLFLKIDLCKATSLYQQ